MDPTSEQLTPASHLPEQIEAPEAGKTETTATPEKSQPQHAEQAGAAINQASTGAAPALSLPPLAAPNPVPAAPTTDDSAVAGTPLIADDVEVIEKEWVDKAGEIVRQTKDDPYRQEQAVEALHQAYLKKRYNKDLKSSTSTES